MVITLRSLTIIMKKLLWYHSQTCLRRPRLLGFFVFLLLRFRTLTPLLGYYCNRRQWSSETPPRTISNRKQRFIPPLSYPQASRWWQGSLLGVESPLITDLVQFSGKSYPSFPFVVSHYFGGHQVYGKGWGNYLSATKFSPFRSLCMLENERSEG